MDDDGFAQFIGLRYAALLRTAYLLTGSPQAAEDLVQSCLLKVMPRFAKVADPMAYLRRSMVNHRTSLWRRAHRERLGAQPPDVGLPDHASGLADRATLMTELGRLPRRMRAVLVLRYWEDLSEAETASLLGCSVGAVKSQASRGLARLRAVLTEPTPPRSETVRRGQR